MELLTRYSGITAIIVYLLLFWLYMKLRGTRKASEPEEEAAPVKMQETPAARSLLDVNDEDAVVAALIASIDYRQENKTDVRVLSVREVR